MKALYYSVASACVAGLLTGGVMKLGPDALAERPTGPQILLAGAPNRVIDNDGWYADAILTSYSGEIPEYVLGTDWTQPAYIASVSYDHGYEPVAYGDETARKVPPPAQPAVYTHPVRPKPDKPKIAAAPSYPSVDGDVIGPRDEWAQPQIVDLTQYETESFSS